MPDNYFVLDRKLAKMELLEYLKENKDLSVEKALALFSYKHGFRLAKVREYLEELVLAGLIKIEHDSIKD